jgi:hypothetical protein
MYNSKLVCTYSYYDPNIRVRYHSNEKFDLEDVDGFEDLSEMIYQTELLKALGFSSGEIDNGKLIDFNLKSELLTDLCNKMKDNDIRFLECIESVREKHICEDLESGFIILFSYDYFFLTHKCICDLLTSGQISDESIIRLKSAFE